MPNKHSVSGVIFLVVFLGTGLWMHAEFPEAYRENLGMRLMYRSAHVYILLSALLNLVLSGARPEPRAHWRRLMTRLGSGMLAVAPLSFTAAFFLEPAPDSVARPFVLFGCVWLLAGSLAFAVAQTRFGREPSSAAGGFNT